MTLPTALTAETGRATVEDARDLVAQTIERLQTALCSLQGSLTDSPAPFVELDWAVHSLLDCDHALSIAIQEIMAVTQQDTLVKW